jgi:hypothetical protein
MKIKNLTEGLNAQQSSVPQLPAKAQAQHISVLGAKKDPRHPFAGYAVGASESADAAKKRLGPDQNDPWEQGWRANPARAENPYRQGTPEYAQWEDGQAERRAQPRHYDEGVTEAGRKQPSPKFTRYSDAEWTAELARRRSAAGEDPRDTYQSSYSVERDYVDNYRVLYVVDKKKKTVVGMWYSSAGIGTFVPPGRGFSDMIYYVSNDPYWPYGDKEGEEDLYEMGRAGVDDTDTVGFSVNSEAAYMAVMKRFGDVIDHDETSGIMYAPARVWPQIEMTAFDADPDSGAVRVEDDVMETADDYIRRSAVNYQYRRDNGRWYQRHLITATSNLDKELDLLKNDKNVRKIQVIPNINETSVAEGERNEMDTPAVQAALAKMAERHRGEKWTKEQLAALGKRIAARGQKPVKEDDVEDFLARGGKITQVKPNRGPRYPGTSLGSKHIGTLRGGRASSISGKSANTRPTVKPVVAVESITKEDIISKLKARLGDYLSDISKEIKKDPDLVDKLSAKAPGDQMGPPVKTVTTDDGKEIQIHGNEDDGFRVSIKNRPANTKFKNLDEAVMACEIYCARRRNGQADYLDEA